MTGELIQHLFDGDGLVSTIRQLRDDVERLKLAGYTGEGGASPGALLTPAQASAIGGIQTFGGGTSSVLLGDASTAAIGTNEVVGRTASGAVDGIAVDAQSVLGRAAGAVDSLTASASQILGRLSTGDLGFLDRLTWAADQDVLVSETWPYEEVTGSTTVSEAATLILLDLSSDATVTLPRPTNSGKVYIVADPEGTLSGSSEVTFDTGGGSDEINGNTGATSNSYGVPYSIFVFVGTLTSGPSARWSARLLNTPIS